MEYTLIRSARRTLAIEIDREGALVVRAPRRMPVCEIEHFLLEKSAWIEKHAALQKQKLTGRPVLTAEEDQALRAKAKAYLPGRLAFYAEKMGLPVPKMTVTSARTRYGSCSARNTVSFSRYLMANDPEAIDYVVVHELSHIRHKDHSAAFYAEVAAVLPDWQRRKKLLFMPETEENA